MSADVIEFADHAKLHGNGARENVQRYFEAIGFGGLMPANTDGVCLPWIDHFLACMWLEGFKIVPLEPGD
jgi:hypothetical protein